MDAMERQYVITLSNEVINGYTYVFEDLDEDDILLLWQCVEDMDSREEAYEAVEEYLFNFKIIHDDVDVDDVDEGPTYFDILGDRR